WAWGTPWLSERMERGSIGPKTTVVEPLATQFAEACLERFPVRGRTIGDAVRGARLALLKVGNPLGLGYIPVVVPGLQLVQPVASADLHIKRRVQCAVPLLTRTMPST